MALFLPVASVFDSWTTVFCAVVVGYLVYFLLERRILNLPPGPLGLPLVGYGPFMTIPPFRQFSELGKKYGDVLRVNVYGTNVIILNSYDAIKECFSTRKDDFAGRVTNEKSLFSLLFRGLGFLQEEGPVLQEYRRFSIHTFKDFGFGKLSLERRVQEISTDLVNGLANTRGEPIDPANLLANAACNVILYLTTDKNFKPDDPDFQTIRRNTRTTLTLGADIKAFVTTPDMRFLPMKWQKNISTVNRIRNDILRIAEKFIKEHEERFDENNLRDFIDVYLAKRNEKIREGKKDTTFTIERLSIVLLNMIVAATESASSTLNWALWIISSRPEIQAKLHKELDEVVGRERLPSILDRPNLHFLEAFTLEVLRFTSVAPLGIPHSNQAASTLKDYRIPAKSVIMANFWAVHNDPEFWEDPEKFDPDRFMDAETIASRKERVLAFSLGKRSCLGESLARMELFLFLTMLLQKFTFRLCEGDFGDLREAKTLIRVLEPYEIHAEHRT